VGLFEPKWQKEKGNQLTNRPQIGGRNQRRLSTDPNAESIAGDDRATRRNRIEEEPSARRGGKRWRRTRSCSATGCRCRSTARCSSSPATASSSTLTRSHRTYTPALPRRCPADRAILARDWGFWMGTINWFRRVEIY
jgi:hypothetical protein